MIFEDAAMSSLRRPMLLLTHRLGFLNPSPSETHGRIGRCPDVASGRPILRISTKKLSLGKT